ncbi:hypothetical protein BK128_21400 [Viridibacillus sp. FSL H7-0596]|uniref:conserved phage C-terminal domain-containing protein n=1 Tax=Viridibacillus sp. FSL H7-0596 TaxID=1928923 RepID=UPI00096BEDF5|nr:conserved phage C-terminal domain-containing protein [Viridibacillus sp. FSL H7-0596]OMC81829.1 hypothetical protein BK128_21400 [Viridibacillus sp. FSL H7-0596]
MATNLLINEPPLQVLPSLATAIGLNEAIVVQQVHYWIGISKNHREGHKWVYKTFDAWGEEFPFWSTSTIKRTIKNLEMNELLISTNKFNKLGIDRTKWYRVNYEKLAFIASCQNDPMDGSICNNESVQNDTTHKAKMTPPITREYTETTTKNNNVVKHDNMEIFETILNYLNEQAGTRYKCTAKNTQKLIKARLNEGFTINEFKSVIDNKVKIWLHDPEMNRYLRPETLFGTKFEGYLNERSSGNLKQNASNKSNYFRFNPNEGEDL